MTPPIEASDDPYYLALKECLADDRTMKKDCMVYACILESARGNVSRPSRVRIANCAGVHYVNVTRHTQKLATCGYIGIRPTKGKLTNVYTLLRLQDMGITNARVAWAPEVDMGITADTGINSATVEKSNVQGLQTSNMGITADTGRISDIGISPDTHLLRAGKDNNGNISVRQVQSLWNEHRLPLWLEWMSTTQKRRQQVESCLALMSSLPGFENQSVDAVAVVELFDFLKSVPLYNGSKVKDDGQPFVLSPTYIFSDEDRFARILEGEWSEYGKDPNAKRKGESLADHLGRVASGRKCKPLGDDMPDSMRGAI